MRIIVLLDVDYEDNVEIATNDEDVPVCFSSYEEADDWCARNTTRRWVKCVNLDDDDDD